MIIERWWSQSQGTADGEIAAEAHVTWTVYQKMGIVVLNQGQWITDKINLFLRAFRPWWNSPKLMIICCNLNQIRRQVIVQCCWHSLWHSLSKWDVISRGSGVIKDKQARTWAQLLLTQQGLFQAELQPHNRLLHHEVAWFLCRYRVDRLPLKALRIGLRLKEQMLLASISQHFYPDLHFQLSYCPDTSQLQHFKTWQTLLSLLHQFCKWTWANCVFWCIDFFIRTASC